jgi:hypothetical protein
MQEEMNFNDPKFRAILDKILDLFREFGIRSLNMDDISRSLGMSKKTLYQYVKSKEDLIEKLFYYDEIKWSETLSQINPQEMNAIEILFKVSIMVAEETAKLDSKTRFELKKYYEPIFNEFLSRKQVDIFNHISKNLHKGIKEGLYRADLNVDLVAGIYVRNLVDLNNKEFCFFGNISYQEVFEVLFEGHIRATATPEGIAYFERRKAEVLGNK